MVQSFSFNQQMCTITGTFNIYRLNIERQLERYYLLAPVSAKLLLTLLLADTNRGHWLQRHITCSYSSLVLVSTFVSSIYSSNCCYLFFVLLIPLHLLNALLPPYPSISSFSSVSSFYSPPPSPSPPSFSSPSLSFSFSFSFFSLSYIFLNKKCS